MHMLHQVLHVVEVTNKHGGLQNPVSYVSLSSLTPGKLTKEVKNLHSEGFICGEGRIVDLVTFTIHYGCTSFDNSEAGWSESEIPTMHVESDTKGNDRVTVVSIDAGISTRWFLAINTKEIQNFKLEGASGVLVPRSDKSDVDGWHIIQYSGGKDSPTVFSLTLFWFGNGTYSSQEAAEPHSPLLKLRTDVNRVTPKVARAIEKLPSWCSIFGKSTSPLTLSFLNTLEVDL
ncbi:hypothetical protein EJ110_NYTH57919 [Nymphaea thermarum]|nr:hypothetical protein EJ110_NYTH57919 [Nymphaea thermarum]